MAHEDTHERTNIDRELDALPVDLQPLYQRLASDGSAWQAASADALESLSHSLIDHLDRIVQDETATPRPRANFASMAIRDAPTDMPVNTVGVQGSPQRRGHRREWLVGTLSAVAVVVLLALMLHGALQRRVATGPRLGATTGHWQVLSNYTVQEDSVASQPAVVAPSDPQVAYEPTNSISGQGGKAGTFASLRRTEDGGATWHNVALPLPVEAVETIQLQVSPLDARAVFASIWDRTSISCEPTNGAVGEGCERGYVSFDGGDSWQVQKLPARGILDLNQPMAIQQNRLFETNVCNDSTCVHLMLSADGGRTWQVVDDQLTAMGQHVFGFTATPNAGIAYVLTTSNSSPGASDYRALTGGMTLWRSDDVGSQLGASSPDAGTHWGEAGVIPTEPRSAFFPEIVGDSLLSAPEAGTLYFNEPYYTTGKMAGVQYSDDYGATWKTTPLIPETITSALSDASVAAMHDGTLVVTVNQVGMSVNTYTWLPGETAWKKLPPLPNGLSGLATVTVNPGGSWRDSILLHLNHASPGKSAYYILRYVK